MCLFLKTSILRGKICHDKKLKSFNFIAADSHSDIEEIDASPKKERAKRGRKRKAKNSEDSGEDSDEEEDSDKKKEKAGKKGKKKRKSKNSDSEDFEANSDEESDEVRTSDPRMCAAIFSRQNTKVQRLDSIISRFFFNSTRSAYMKSTSGLRNFARFLSSKHKV